MKLDEVIHTVVTKLPAAEYNAPNPTGEFAGSGHFSHVMTTPDPFLVKKVARDYTSSLNRDAYFQYVHAIVENNLAEENPYYPRIYEITLQPLNSDMHSVKYHVDMEKLVSFDSDNAYTKEEMIAMLRRCLNCHWTDEELADYRPWHLADYISDNIEGYLKNYSSACGIVDPLLKDALGMIKKLKEEFGFSYDIKRANMMIRRTSLGLQLVLTDPLLH